VGQAYLLADTDDWLNIRTARSELVAEGVEIAELDADHEWYRE
jgi:hypothetical protein